VLAEVLGGSTAVLAVALGVLWWYHKWSTRDLSTRVVTAENAVGILKSVNTDLRASLNRVVADTAARNEREAHDDAHTAAAAAGSPSAAAALLNGLHPDGASPGGHAQPGVPAAGVPAVPQHVSLRMR
jgi:hypothetical protein